MSGQEPPRTIGQMPDHPVHEPAPASVGGYEETPIPRLALVAVLLLVAIGGAIDIVLDRPANGLTPHIVLETLLMAVSLGFAVHLWRGWRATSSSLRKARFSLAEREAERDAWRARARSAIASFAAAVQTQLDEWHLTPTEREVALLLLEGLGHKQIAARTGRSERTVRQHAVSIYDKAGVGGRAELAAFFLSGLGGARQAKSDLPSDTR